MAKPKLALIPCTQGYFYSSVLPSDGSGDFRGGRSGKATRINSQGLIEEVDDGVSRLNYPMIDGKVVGCPHHILEPEARNVIINSNVFTPNSNIIVNTNSSISPDGTLNSVKVSANSGTSLKLVDTNGASSGTYRFSVFAKKGTHNIMQLGGGGIVGHANFNLETGEYSSYGSMDYYGNGWYRCSVQFLAGIPTSHYVSFSDSLSANRLSTSVSDGNFYLYGMQSETTSHTTSYIPTTTTSVTRSAETANNSGDADTFNDSEGVLMAEISALANDGTNRYIGLTDGTISNRINILIDDANKLIGFVSGSSGIESNVNVTNFSKCAFKYKSGSNNFWVNGFKVGSNTDAISLSGLSDISFNTAYPANTASPFYGKTKQLQYFQTALTDSELEQLTSWTSFSDMAQGQLYTIE